MRRALLAILVIGSLVIPASSVLADDKGMLKDGYSADGLHPNAKGYELMAPLAEAAIDRALQ